MSRTTKDQVMWRINNACRMGQDDPDPDRFDELQAKLWVTHPYMSSGRLHRPKARPDVVREEAGAPNGAVSETPAWPPPRSTTPTARWSPSRPPSQHRQGVTPTPSRPWRLRPARARAASSTCRQPLDPGPRPPHPLTTSLCRKALTCSTWRPPG